MSSIEMSKFMKSLVEQMESKGLSDKTIKMYLQRLYIINGKKKFTSLVFLRDTSSIIDYLKQNLSQMAYLDICHMNRLNIKKK